MVSKARADQISGGVFFIGLGLIFFTHVEFWPWILFVIGASSIARGMAEGRAWYSVSGGLFFLGLGLVFLFGFSLPLLLIICGITMLFGYSFRPARVRIGVNSDNDDWDKPKNDEKRKNDDFDDSAPHTVYIPSSRETDTLSDTDSRRG